MWQLRRAAIRTGRRGIGGGLKGAEEEGMPTVTPKHQWTINNQRIDGSRVIQPFDKDRLKGKWCCGRPLRDLNVLLGERYINLKGTDTCGFNHTGHDHR